MKVRAATVSAWIFRRRGKGVEFLVLKRTPDRGGFWQCVSGKAKKRETGEEAARREIDEETGLPVKRLFAVDSINAYYENGVVILEPNFGAEAGPGDVRLSREHTEHRWTSFAGAMKLLKYPGNREGLAAVNRQIGLRGTPT